MPDRYLEQARRFVRIVREHTHRPDGTYPVYLPEEDLAETLTAPKALTNSWPQGPDVKPTDLDGLMRYLHANPWVEIVTHGTTYLRKFRYSVPSVPYGGIDIVAASIASVNERGEPNGEYDPLLGQDWRFSEEGFSFYGHWLENAPPPGSRTYRYHDRSQPFVQLWVASGWRPNPAYVKPTDG